MPGGSRGTCRRDGEEGSASGASEGTVLVVVAYAIDVRLADESSLKHLWGGGGVERGGG